MLVAVDALGTIPGWLTLIVLLGSGLYVLRHGGSTAIETLSKANDVLTKRVQDMGGEVRDLKAENAKLTGRTDVVLALGPVLEWTAKHEERAQERHLAMLRLLDLIAERLGPDHHTNAA